VPVLLIEMLVKVATPLTAFAVLVPLKVPPAGLVAMPIVIEALLLVPVLPKLSCTATASAGVIEVPAVVLVGCCTKASLFAAAGLTVIEFVVPFTELVTVSVAVTV
jgi:hypothetical protein